MNTIIEPAFRRLFDAQTHWHRANEKYFNPNDFRISINACIQELRNVTFVLQKQKSKIQNFDSWYGSWQEKMKANPSLKWLVGARNYIVKQGDLELKSILRIGLIGSYREDEVPVLEQNYDPKLTNDEILAELKKLNIPKEIFDDSYIKIERRWVDSNYPNHELLELLTNCWSSVIELLLDAPDSSVRQKRNEENTAPHPPCMYKGSETRCCWMKLIDDELVVSSMSLEAPDLDPLTKEDIKEKYGGLPILDKKPDSNNFKVVCENTFKTAMTVLEKDLYHIHVSIIFKDELPVKIVEFRNEDQADKYRSMRLIASEIEQIGADQFIMISEVWTAPFDPSYPHRGASKSPDRTEVLSLVGISKQGEEYVYSVPFSRENEKISYGEPNISGIEGMNIIEPILSIWRKNIS